MYSTLKMAIGSYDLPINDNTVTIAKTRNGELVEEELNVPANFRKMIMKILLDFGVDKQEAEKILTNDYQFKDLSALYEVSSELILNYAGTGKKFNFIAKWIIIWISIVRLIRGEYEI